MWCAVPKARKPVLQMIIGRRQGRVLINKTALISALQMVLTQWYALIVHTKLIVLYVFFFCFLVEMLKAFRLLVYIIMILSVFFNSCYNVFCLDSDKRSTEKVTTLR